MSSLSMKLGKIKLLKHLKNEVCEKLFLLYSEFQNQFKVNKFTLFDLKQQQKQEKGL